MPVEELNTLIVTTFGSFSIRYNGKELSMGNLNGLQTELFLQLLLHFRREGVPRELAKNVLFGDRDIEDVSHSLRNIIYNLRKKLRELGLPESKYVVKHGGIYYWCDDIPVKEDATDFDDSFDRAMEIEDEVDRLHQLSHTIGIYKGKFLDGSNNAVWIRESERYSELFSECVNEIAYRLKANHQYKQLHKLGLYAAKVDPFSEWETLMMEALAGLGRYDQTEKLYRQTIDAYSAEYGGRTNSYVREFARRLGAKLVVSNETLEEIQKKIGIDDPPDNNGYYTSLPAFQEIYRMTERMFERAGEKIYLMLCTITDRNGEPMKEGVRLEELAERLRETIVQTVRRTDTVTRYGQGQFLVLLVNITYEDCAAVSRRIDSEFTGNEDGAGVSYSVNNVIVSAYPNREAQ